MAVEACMYTISQYRRAGINVDFIMVFGLEEGDLSITKFDLQFVCTLFHVALKGQFIVQPDSQVFIKFNIFTFAWVYQSRSPQSVQR